MLRTLAAASSGKTDWRLAQASRFDFASRNQHHYYSWRTMAARTVPGDANRRQLRRAASILWSPQPGPRRTDQVNWTDKFQRWISDHVECRSSALVRLPMRAALLKVAVNLTDATLLGCRNACSLIDEGHRLHVLR